MFRNYLKIAWRIFIRQKQFSFVNIVGLAIGMTACLLIVQYIGFELGYDDFHKNGSHIYRIRHQQYSQGNLVQNSPRTYSAVGPALKNEFPEVQEVTRIAKSEGLIIAKQPGGSIIAFNEKNLYQVDPSFLRIFSFPMREGSLMALNNPNTIVITERAAKKYFPNQDALGKTINLQQQASGTDITATVTGVCENVPVNSHLQFDFLISGDAKSGDWIFPDYYTYVLLSPQTNAKAFEDKLPAFVKKYSIISNETANSSPTQGKTNLNNILFTLQPLEKIHLYSNLSGEISVGGNGNMVWWLGVIAVFILIIAYINYVNLSTAKVIERAKEVGIRKVLGSLRRQLITQFLFESFLINFFSLSIATLAVELLMPWFSKLCGVQMSFTVWRDIFFLIGFAGILSAGILLSAIYPALILSNYKPVQVLKGTFIHSGQSISLRKTLVVFQFVAAIAFLIGTVIVYSQVDYMKNENRRMDMKQTLVLAAPQNIRASDADNLIYMRKDSVFQTEILRNPRVQGITSSSSIPGEIIEYTMSYTSHAQTAAEKSLRLATFEIGTSFIDQFKIKIIAGDNFSNNWSGREPTMMLNESAVVSLGFKNPKDAIGKFIETKNGSGRLFKNEITGVIQDFHQASLKEDFIPIVFRLSDANSITHYELKVNSNDMPHTIAQIEKTYKSIFTESAFEYFFLDDFFDEQYKSEQHFGQVFSLFSGLAIVVTCFGLFGLTLITITQRLKEIGIRKVLGASISNILFLISKDFISLLCIASVIAIPLAYWGAHEWLQNYKFRIHITIWYFLIPLLIIILITSLTISFKAIKAAMENPVRSLRAE
ncbi:MAG: ABC transporter permease [Bacteroidetes bacterium]|nr:ABC transporter permease [Bacteroidota bacterium]